LFLFTTAIASGQNKNLLTLSLILPLQQANRDEVDPYIKKQSFFIPDGIGSKFGGVHYKMETRHS
jgi:hypothetical protein